MFPTFFRIPLPWGASIPIHAYGVMVALGMLAAIWVTAQRARRAGVSPEVFYDLGFWSMIAGILGARLAYVQAHWDQYRDNLLMIFKIWEGGQVLYGGLILAILVDLWFLKRKNLPVLKMADLAAPAVPLGIAIGRIGCLLNGCCWGHRVPEAFPLGLRFPPTSGVYLSPDGFVGSDAPWPVHPAQIYATLLGLALYVVLSIWFERRSWDGQIFSGMLMGYAGIRILEEHFRADTPRSLRFWGLAELTAGQYVSVFLLAGGLLAYLLWGAKGRTHLSQL